MVSYQCLIKIIIIILFSLLLIVWDIDKGDNGIINAGGGDDVDDDGLVQSKGAPPTQTTKSLPAG